jgi:spermidine/putrescine-binding protein
MTTIRRRTLLRGAAAVATTASLGLRGVARAVAEPLVINSYGGAFEKFMRQEIIPVFEKETGIKTRLDIGLGSLLRTCL